MEENIRTRLDISTKMKDFAMFINFLVPSTTSSGFVPVFLDGTTAAASGVPSSDDIVAFVLEVALFETRMVFSVRLVWNETFYWRSNACNRAAFSLEACVRNEFINYLGIGICDHSE